MGRKELQMLTPHLIVGFCVMAAGLAFLRPRRAVVPGIVLVAAVVAMLGFEAFPAGPSTEASTGGEHVNLFGVLRHASARSHSSDFESARLMGAMGQWTLDLRHATIPPGDTAVVDVFAALGRVTVLLPDGWTVDLTGLQVTGFVDDARGTSVDADSGAVAAPPAAAPRLVLRGVMMLGKVEIDS
jgi:hypothetical protein